MAEYLKIELLGSPSIYYVTDYDGANQSLAYPTWYVSPTPGTYVLWTNQTGDWGGDEYATIECHIVDDGWDEAGVIYVTCDRTLSGQMPYIYTGSAAYPSGEYPAYYSPEGGWGYPIVGGSVRVTHVTDYDGPIFWPGVSDPPDLLLPDKPVLVSPPEAATSVARRPALVWE